MLLVGTGAGSGTPASGASGATTADVPIVFGTTTGSGYGIGVVNADGSGRKIILTPGTHRYFVQPDLSPDGRRIIVPFAQARYCGSLFGQQLRNPSVGVALVP